MGGAASTSDRGDELLQPTEQLSVDLEVVEMMFHPVAAHIEHPAITSSLHQRDITLQLLTFQDHCPIRVQLSAQEDQCSS